MSDTAQHAGAEVEKEKGGTLGLPQATALVMGGIIGTGIFGLPYSLAQFGMLAVVTLVIVTIGALALALMFGSLVKRIPAAGGPYAYSRYYFGDFAGFTSAWPYWITAWAGNAGIVVIWVGYVQSLFGIEVSAVSGIIIALIGLWIPALVNLAGVKSMGSFQLITTILKFIPIVFIGTIGLVYGIKEGNFPTFNPTGDNPIAAILNAMTIALFVYLGVELASVAAAKIKDPTKNVPIATTWGTVASGIAYILCLVAVFGIVPPDQLAGPDGSASFSLALSDMFGGAEWASKLMSAFVVISGIGALNGWTMICAEMPQAAADEGLFPAIFSKLNKAKVPYWGIIISTILASAFTIFSYMTASGADVLNTLILVTGVTAAVPYFFSALSQLYYLLTEGRLADPKAFVKETTIAVIALIFSFLFVYGSGESATFYAYLLILVGYVVLLTLYVKRKKAGGVVEGDSSPELTGSP